MRRFTNLILFSIFLFLLKVDGFALNTSQLIQRSRQLIADTSYLQSPPKLSDQRILDYLNEGQRYAAANGWFLVQRTTFALIAGTTEYSLPSDYQTSKRIFFEDKILTEQTIESLDYQSGSAGGDWISSSGDPVYYYTRTTTGTVMGFYPWPVSGSTGVVTLDYLAQPNTLSVAGNIPFLGIPDLYPLHEALPKFVAYRFFLTIGNVPLADVYAKEFSADIKRMKEILESKPNYKPGFSAVR